MVLGSSYYTLMHRAVLGGVHLSLVCSLQAALEWEAQEATITARPEDKATTARFKFTNTGNAKVTINEVPASCSCIAAELERKSYAPGESGEIAVTLSHGMRTGNVRQSVKVKTSDPSLDTELKLEVAIPKLYSCDTNLLFWKKGEPLLPKKANLTFHAGLPVKILSLNSENPNFTVKAEAAKEGESYRIVVTPIREEGADTKLLKSVIHIQTDFKVPGRSNLTLYAIVNLAPVQKEQPRVKQTTSLPTNSAALLPPDAQSAPSPTSKPAPLR